MSRPARKHEEAYLNLLNSVVAQAATETPFSREQVAQEVLRVYTCRNPAGAAFMVLLERLRAAEDKVKKEVRDGTA